MKKKIFFLLIILLTFLNNISYGQTLSYANFETIVKTSEAGKNIITYFSEKNQKLVKSIEEKKKIIKEKESSLVSQKNILEPNEYSKKVNLLRDEVNKFKIESDENFKKIKLEEDKVLQSFLNEINKILREYAEKNSIDMIISSNQILIGKSELDVTKEILELVNNKIKKFEIKYDN